MLRPNVHFPIGRASKSTQKPGLVVAADNAYIDSPVVSREHASLLLSTSPRTPGVYILDCGSMHGTIVNGKKLEPDKALKLANGDLLQFGVDVTRNESTLNPASTLGCHADLFAPDFYIARKYVFASSHPANSFSRGFSVPDVESSEGEEAEIHYELGSPPPDAGSEMNPVTIEDDESERHDIILIDDDDGGSSVHSEPNEMGEEAPPEPTQNAQAASAVPKEPTYDQENPDDFLDASGDELSDHHFNASDDELSMDEDNMSLEDAPSDDCASPGDSEPESEISGEDSDDEIGAPGRGFGMRAPIFSHEPVKSPIQEKSDNSQQVPTSIAAPSLPSPPTPNGPLRNPFKANVPLSEGSMKIPEPEAPAVDSYFNPGPMLSFHGPAFGFMDSPVPPRPVCPKEVNWNFGASMGPRESSGSQWYTGEELQQTSIFMPAPSGLDVFGQPPGMGEPILPKPYGLQPPHSPPDNRWAPQYPPMPPQPAASVSCEVPAPQPSRRTGVSIPEIVEEAPQPPQTPPRPLELKRKADVLEEETSHVVVEPTSTPATADVDTPAVPVEAKPSTSIEDRPKKRPRGRLGNAMKTMAAYLIPGTAVAVGILTQLPESFFKA